MLSDERTESILMRCLSQMNKNNNKSLKTTAIQLSVALERKNSSVN